MLVCCSPYFDSGAALQGGRGNCPPKNMVKKRKKEGKKRGKRGKEKKKRGKEKEEKEKEHV